MSVLLPYVDVIGVVQCCLLLTAQTLRSLDDVRIGIKTTGCLFLDGWGVQLPLILSVLLQSQLTRKFVEGIRDSAISCLMFTLQENKIAYIFYIFLKGSSVLLKVVLIIAMLMNYVSIPTTCVLEHGCSSQLGFFRVWISPTCQQI